MTGGIAHDFNNLLTVVISGLHMLGRAETDERREQLIGRIGEAASRGSELTRRLLAFGRRQALRPEPLNLPEHMADLCELLGHSLRADVTLDCRAEPDVWAIEVDRGALELALLNLSVNARDALPHGGTIILSARNMRLGEEAAAAVDLSPGDYVEVAVADSGSGMRPEVLARVFEPFFTTKEAGQGSGLGLPQVYGFARQSGGTARVQSEPGEGCTVSILLPRTERVPVAADPRRGSVTAAARDGRDGRRAADLARAARLTPAAWGAEKSRPEEAPARDGAASDGMEAGDAAERLASVLVVEDDDEVAALVLELMGQFGHDATRVSSVDAALGALAHGSKVDVVFSDVLLPGGANGVDLAHEVSKRRPDVGIVLTSGYGPDMIGRMGEVHWPLLRKPYPPDALRAAIEESLREHGAMPPPKAPHRRVSPSFIGY